MEDRKSIWSFYRERSGEKEKKGKQRKKRRVSELKRGKKKESKKE